MRSVSILVSSAVLCIPWSSSAQDSVVDKHVKVYYEKGRFGGFPANHGIWTWGNEILVGFSRGYYKDLGDERHNIDRERPEEHALARSLDGGETWTLELPYKNGFLVPHKTGLHGVELPGVEIREPVACPGGINFTHPDFAMTLRMFGPREARGIFYYSYDRGHKWEGPFGLPNLGTAGLVPRTDYIVENKDSVTVFLTANKSDKKEGRVLCARTSDGGATWKFISWVTPEPPPSANYPPNGYSYAIMPSAVRLSDKDLVCAVRWREGKPSWITVYDSHDNGKTWNDLGKVVPSTGEGNPPSMIKLKDGRICLTYGYRAEPYSICAKISADGGKTWTKEIVLRNDGGNRDLGYPRTVLRPDGKVVTTYYIWDKESGPERYIGATIWDPSRIK